MSAGLLQSQCLEMIDGAAGEALPITGIVMFGHDVFDFGFAEERGKRGPVDDAITGRGPAIIFLCAERRGVFGLDGDDPAGEATEFGGRIGAGPNNPAAIDLEFYRIAAGFKDVVDWAGAIGQGGEFKVVIVPSDGKAVAGDGFSAPGKLFTEAAPVVSVRLALIGGDIGRDQLGGAEGLGDVDEALRLADEASQGHVKAEAL